MKNKMIESNLKNKFVKNIIYAFSAQGVSLLLSITLSLIVPKALGVEDYSYWQLFIFYIGYVGIFHLGLNDGIYLRLGGNKYENINFSLIGTQYKLLLFLLLMFATIIGLTSIHIDNPDRKYILIISAIYMLISNATMFLGYIFQAVNKTKIFSVSVIIDRSFLLVSILTLILIGIENYRPFIIVYLISKLVEVVYYVYFSRKIIFSKWHNTQESLCEMWLNISVGVNLVLANISSMLILGSGRLIIDKIWGVLVFGKISLSLTLTSFFLVFIAQISMVLFPTLRIVDKERLVVIYFKMRDVLGLFLPLILLAYYPLKYLLELWIPEYQDSLRYLALLLPLCTFDGKMQLLYNTFFKVLREEKRLLKYNIITFIVSFTLCMIGGYLLHNLNFIIISLIASIAFRSIISELYLTNLLGGKVFLNVVQEVILVLLFMISSWYFSPFYGFVFFFFAYSIYLFINQKKLKRCKSILLKK
ncbi:hypothetical protein [Metabacillus indicus]|uniref:hypothetical protein n=1 Tax=Metabacillus indicus TaxID=246786 RepID=UPI00248FA1EB|nr:hypothetical protein [Metabacillus indicus]